MDKIYEFPGYKLPVNPAWETGTVTKGFVTPSQDRIPQVLTIPPRRVLPIIFLPGIMGSNLRMSAERQRQLGKSNNIAWRPEHKGSTLPMMFDSPAERQQRLDPKATEVDTYDPVNNPTGDRNETSDERNSEVEVDFQYKASYTQDPPFLRNDPYGAPARKFKEQKARERGWGEVFFDSYRELLEMCEERLNTAFFGGKMDPWWERIVTISPTEWQAHSQPALTPLDEKTLRAAVKGTWFPVHAIGYNWLESNSVSGVRVADRITALLKLYQEQKFQCEKVILVTHSMGGLVARAVIHPRMGRLNDKILGIVHGVMPAIGAAAAYKRIRCGFEDGALNPAAKVLGNYGDEVTAVLGNAQGGLELLPSQAYGNDWLRVTLKRKEIKSLPRAGDPYEEIYKVQGKWYSLLREEWINPARRRVGSSFQNTCNLLDRAKEFHNAIVNTYHDQSYGHYGADRNNAAWHRVTWSFNDAANLNNLESVQILDDDRQGELTVFDPTFPTRLTPIEVQFNATMLAATDPGDQTVPLHSAEHQLRSGKFKGIFRQSGYEHQASYSDVAALHSTLYSLIRIANSMVWSK